MADLSINCAGIKSPNPFWLASAPPTNSGGQIQRAFDLGWGGAVWKTLGDQIINVNSRFWSLDYGSTRMMGLNNIELITARPWETNIREIIETKKKYPKNAVIVSMMIESKQEAWHEAVKEVNDTGCDGIELNFGCPHGMSERGMGSAVGQVPEYTKMITEWVKEVAEVPVLVKLTPNISNVAVTGRAAAAGKADGISLINTINSIMGVDLDNFAPFPASMAKARTAVIAARPSNRLRSIWSAPSRRTPTFASPFPASAASRRGRMPSSSWCSAPPACRSVPPSCITAIASSRT